jgi:signal transduction histidine kinase
LADRTAADFSNLIASRIAAEHVSISARWLERLRTVLTVDANEIFPTEHLLDHIPALIREVTEYVRAPDAEAVAANTAIITKAQELGRLRHAQRASVHQLLTEYRLLGGILSSFVQEELQRLGVAPEASEAVEVLRRLQDAIWILSQTTVDTFVAEYTGTIASHTARLESFNRMVSHELRQPLGTLMYALPLLRAETARGDSARQEHLLAVMERNIRRLMQQMEQLEALSRMQTPQADSPELQQTDISTIASEVGRQLREMAEARGVVIQVSDDLPEILVDTARLELILMNLVSNAIKYSDPDKADRFVRVDSQQDCDEESCCLVVSDNGLGIPEGSVSAVFRRHTRAHADRDGELGIRGSGLGLAIVAECVESVGGSIAMDSTVGEGTTFRVTIPRRPVTEA